jgi:hypothetical protein
MYGLFACYAVTGKCDLRIDSQGRDIAVFASLDDCQRFESASAGQPPDKRGRWAVDEGHYFQCFGLMALPVPPAPHSEAPRAVYKTSAEALQRDFQADPDDVTRKIGSAIVEVSGTVDSGVESGGALQLSGDTWDVTAWLTQDGVSAVKGIKRHQHVTLLCDRIGTLAVASGRRPAILELRDCKPANP